jgi:hypothetical protein
MIFYYKHPKTGKIVERNLPITENQEESIILEDGTICKYVPWYVIEKGKIGIIDKNAEVWEKDPDYVRKLNPKFVRRRDGVREKFDPNKHC